MTPLLPLVALLLLSRKKGAKAPKKAKKVKAKAPQAPWPTPAAPPPPSPPALQPPPAPPPPPPLPFHPAAQAAPRPTTGPTARPKAAATRTQPQKAVVRPPVAARPQAATISDITIISAQKKLNRLGANPKLKEDGLYGPKTRGAWISAARLRRQNPAFDRVGPTVARVSAATDMALSKASGVSGSVYIP